MVARLGNLCVPSARGNAHTKDNVLTSPRDDRTGPGRLAPDSQAILARLRAYVRARHKWNFVG